MSEKESTDEKEPRMGFPAWLKELIVLGGLIVTLTIFGQTLKGDQRSTNEKLDRLTSDVSAIRSQLPNREADELRYKTLEQKVDRNRAELDFAIAKLEKWKEETTKFLIKKGVID